MIDKIDSPIIWYVPGFRSGDDPQKDVRRLIQKIYPNTEDFDSIIWENQGLISPNNRGAASGPLGVTNILNAVTKPFRSAAGFLTEPLKLVPKPVIDTITIPARWSQALKDVGTISNMLANRIRSLSSDKRQKLFLIGHSLGGNVVIRTLARLYRQNLFIHSALLLGAAIGNRDENIPLAINATLDQIHSMYNPKDEKLAAYETLERTPALGKSGCGLVYNHTKFHEHSTDNSTTHSSDFYLSQWASYVNFSRCNQSNKYQ